MDPNEFAIHAALEDEHWWFRARRNIISAALEKYAPQQRKHLLEIGCGTGGNLRFFAPRFAAVTGVDAAPQAVAFARQRVPGEVFCGDFRELLRGRWHDYDVVLLADVLEHVEHHHELLRDLVTELKPGATLIITVPAHPWLWSPHDAALGHFRRYTLETLRATWAALPVRTHFMSHFNTLLLPLIALARYTPQQKAATSHSDLQQHGAFMNRLLYAIFNSETFWLRHARLPLGCSALAVLQKLPAVQS